MTMCLMPPSLSLTSTEKEFATFFIDTTLRLVASLGSGACLFGSLKKRRTKQNPIAKREAPAPKLP